MEEYKKITPTPIYCTFDGELTQGAEYVNGEYTYRYMQKTVYEWDIEYHTNVISWNNMSEDGWGVRKTDNSAPSNEIVSAPCTYINDKAVVSYSNMFNIYTNQAKKLDLSNFNTSNVTNMSGMFYKNTNLKTIYTSDIFNTNSVTSSSNMFSNTTNLVGGAGTTYNNSYDDKTYARIDGGTSRPGYFTLKTN